MSAHWGLPDPAAVEGTDEDKHHAFAEAYAVLRKRIEGFAAVPLHELSAAELRERLRTLGRLTN